MSDLLLKTFDSEATEDLPELQVGDDVTVHFKIDVPRNFDELEFQTAALPRLRPSRIHQALLRSEIWQPLRFRLLTTDGISTMKALRTPLVDLMKTLASPMRPSALPALREFPKAESSWRPDRRSRLRPAR